MSATLTTPRPTVSGGVITPAHLRAAIGLSSALVVVAALACAVSFFVPEVFRDPPAMNGSARGTALVILVVTLPTIVASMVLAARGSVRALIVWAGGLAHVLYYSAYFALGVSFNRLYLFYVAMLSLALWSLVALLIQIDPAGLRVRFAPPTPTRAIALFLLFPVAACVGQGILPNLAAMLSGVPPLSIAGTQLPTSTFDVLNVAFLLPLCSACFVWLWRRQAWGYVAAGPLMIYWVLTLLSIAADQYFGFQADPSSPLVNLSAVPLFAALGFVSLAPVIMYLRRLREKSVGV